MVTKSDFDAFRHETNDNFQSLRDELRDMKQRLNTLVTLVGTRSGYAKEIDHALERIAVIEQHLGIGKRTAV